MPTSYCGIGKLPKGQKKGSMKDCVEKGQIRLYGLFKIDPKLLEVDTKEKKENKVKTYTKKELINKISSINGELTSKKRTVEFSKDKKEVSDAKKKVKELEAERKKFLEYYKKVEKGEKVPKEKTKRKSKK